MKSVLLGKSGITISKFAVGTWQARGWASSDEQKLIQVIHKASDLGINFIDTAESYGDGYAEELINKALGKNRHAWVIGSKFSYRHAERTALRKSLENSLRRLNTDYIDLYQYHWPSANVPFSETFEALKEVKKEGKIRAIGISNWMEPEFERADNLDEIDSLQNCYNLLWRSIENSVTALCKEKSISILPYSPLAQGILAGRFTDLNEIPKDPRRQNVLLTKDNFDKIQPVLSYLEELKNKYSRPINQIALAWLLNRDGVAAIIIGNSSPDQLISNVKSLDLDLDSADMEKLNDLSWPLSKDRAPHDTLWGWHSVSSHKNPLKP